MAQRVRIIVILAPDDTPVPSLRGTHATGLSECDANDPNLEMTVRLTAEAALSAFRRRHAS